MPQGSAGIFLLLLLLHLAAIAALVRADAPISTPKVAVEPPQLQGVLIAPAAKIETPVTKSAPELTKTQPKLAPKKPLTKPTQATPAPVAKAAAPTSAPTSVPNKAVSHSAPARSEKTAEPVTQLPNADAAGLNNKAPVYPLLSRKRKEQGTVYLLLLVSKEGRVTQLKLQKTSGFARLDQAALQAVKHWKFQPARQQGEPIDYWYELPLKFSLQQG